MSSEMQSSMTGGNQLEQGSAEDLSNKAFESF